MHTTPRNTTSIITTMASLLNKAGREHDRMYLTVAPSCHMRDPASDCPKMCHNEHGKKARYHLQRPKKSTIAQNKCNLFHGSLYPLRTEVARRAKTMDDGAHRPILSCFRGAYSWRWTCCAGTACTVRDNRFGQELWRTISIINFA